MGHLSPDLARCLRLTDHVFVSKNVYLLVLGKTVMVINLQSFRANRISWQDQCKHNKRRFVSSTHLLLCPATMYCLISEIKLEGFGASLTPQCATVLVHACLEVPKIKVMKHFRLLRTRRDCSFCC